MKRPRRIKIRPSASRLPDEIAHMTLRRKSTLNEWQQIGVRALLMFETSVAKERLRSVTVYGGFPLSARNVVDRILSQLE